MVWGPFPVAVRLCGVVADRWQEIDAHYHALPIPLLKQPPWRITGLTYAWCVERVNPDSLEEWKAELSDLLPWQSGDSEAAIELESASFAAMQAM